VTAACTACGEPVGPDDRFCEGCGAAVTPDPAASAPPASPTPAPVDPAAADPGATPTAAPAVAAAGPCASCGATDGADPDGFCLACGVRRNRPRDHVETDLTTIAAVTDKGPRKTRNEDACAVALLDTGGFVLAVCDGVSNVARSDEASQAACEAAVAVLRDVPEGAETTALMGRAAAAASAAVVGLAPGALGGEPPSCTFLAARWTPTEGITVGWIGDCRAYLVGPDGARALTTDHSWGTEAVRSGLLSQAEADADGRSHAITRWLGADAGAEPVPDVVCEPVPPGAPSWLVAVSDGAWNYLDGPADLTRFLPAGGPLDAARRITDHAVAGGGHDNITAVVALVGGPALPDDPAPLSDTEQP